MAGHAAALVDRSLAEHSEAWLETLKACGLSAFIRSGAMSD